MTIFTNLILAGSITLIWSFVNALQMIMYLGLCEINFPSNVQVLYQLLLPLSTLDVIPPEASTDILFTFSDDQDYSHDNRLEELGFDSHNFIYNIGSMFYFISFTFIAFVLSGILALCQCRHKFFRNLRRKYRWKSMLSSLYIIF